MKIRKHQLMGVINVTPDSFSDGGKYNSFSSFKKYLEEMLPYVDAIDVGGESTAPKSKEIDAHEEWERLKETLCMFLQDHADIFLKSHTLLSIDTYRHETALKVQHFLNKNNLNIPWMWNDVSGVLDGQLLSLLKNELSQVYYVYSHTFVPHRDETSQHLNYTYKGQHDDLLWEVIKHFNRATQVFQQHDFLDRIYFDPCFGFSKTYEQNHFLLDQFVQVMRSFPLSQKWLVGLSKKTFLRGKDPAGNILPLTSETEKASEMRHKKILQTWQKILMSYSLMYRVHDYKILGS